MGTLGRSMIGALVIALGACSNNSGVMVTNMNPIGTVGGTLLDASTMMPLAGVAVTLQSAGGSFQAMSDGNGFYRLEKVPAGSFSISYALAKYVSTSILETLDGSVGNFPIKNPLLTVPPILMLPVGPNFTVRLVDENGAAVSGVAVQARASASSIVEMGDIGTGVTYEPTGTLTVSATSDMNGRLTFAGLPDPASLSTVIGSQTYISGLGDFDADTIVVQVPPVQVTGQDDYSYAGGLFPFDRSKLTGSLPQIVLAGPTSTLTVVESNVAGLRDGSAPPSSFNPELGSVVPANGPITISFSEAIDPTSLRASLITENGQAGPALTPSVNLNFVSLVPASALTAGARYDLVLHATAALNASAPARQKNAIAALFAQTTDSAPTVVHAVVQNGTVTFTLSEPIGFGDGNPQSYGCVVFYEGIDFDGSGPNTAHVTGEWDMDANALTCNLTSPVTPPPSPTVNASVMNGIEDKGAPAGVPMTGYASSFTANFAAYVTGAMPAPVAGAMLPTVGTKGHLLFSRLTSTVHRVTGQPVGDLTFTLTGP